MSSASTKASSFKRVAFIDPLPGRNLQSKCRDGANNFAGVEIDHDRQI